MSDEPLPVCRVGQLTEPDEKPRWLVDQLWSHAAVGFLAGAPKLGKSWLGLDLALSVATATPCLDRFEVAEPAPVLVYLAEDHPSMVRTRLAGLCRHRGLDLEAVTVHVITATSLRLDLECDRIRLTETVEQISPRLLVLDPLVRLHRRNENDSGEVAELLAYLRELQRGFDVAVCVVHHMRKGGAGRAGQALRGSGDFHAWTDSALYLTARGDRIVLSAEHRAAPAPDTIEIRLCSRADGSETHLEIASPGQLEHRGGAAPSAALDQRLLELLGSAAHPLTRVELRRRLRVNNQRLGQALTDLDHAGLVARSQHGWRLVSAPDSIRDRAAS